MKKFFFVAVAAIVVFASCQKAEQVNLNANQDEVSIIAFNKNMAKGYTGWASGQTLFQEVTDPNVPTDNEWRALQLSGYNTNTEAEFFCDACFKRSATDDLWHAETPIYYPLGDANNIDFLAYSTSKDVATAGKWEGPKKVVFEVGSESFQNDILYAAAKSATKDEKKAVAMTFKHTQAWINMNLCFKYTSATDVENNFTVNDITWNGVKPEGKLTIEGENGAATATWNFFGIEKNNVVMAKSEGIKLPRAAAETITPGDYKKLNMLLPAQAEKAENFTINYTLGGKDYSYEYSEDLVKWEAGKKYTYNITIEILEVTINPTVEIFVDETETVFDIAL